MAFGELDEAPTPAPNSTTFMLKADEAAKKGDMAGAHHYLALAQQCEAEQRLQPSTAWINLQGGSGPVKY